MTDVDAVAMPDEAVLDVVFLHGLDGDARLSWQYGDGDPFWPGWLGEDVDGAAVWSVGYHAWSSRWRGQAMPLQDRAINILAALKTKGIGSRPVVFVTHSMGGLLVKEALLIAASSGSEFAAVAEQVRGVVFLGTPHNGTWLSNVIKVVDRLYRGTQAVRDLKKDGAHLRHLATRYRDWAVEMPDLDHLVFFETWKTNRVQVVTAGSADPGLPRITPVGIDADHLGLCKPANRDSLVYARVTDFVTDIRRSLEIVPRGAPTGAGEPVRHSVVIENHMSGAARSVVQAGSIGGDINFERGIAEDVKSLERVTEEALQRLASHGVLLQGADSQVIRNQVEPLLAVEGSFVVTGEAGCGKSGLLNELAAGLRARGETIVALTIDSLTGPPMTVAPLGEVLQGWPGEATGTLLLDGLDAARSEPLGWLAQVVRGLAGSRWRVIASMRTFDLKHSPLWAEAFPGAPVFEDVELAAEGLAGVRYAVVGDFSPDEMRHLSEAVPEVGQLLDQADPQTTALLKNPFNLMLACELVRSGVGVDVVAAARDRLNLLHRYWETRVGSGVGRTERARVLQALVSEMVKHRRLRAGGSAIADNLLDVLSELVSRGVLTELPSRLLASGPAMLGFRHHILFDYAVAALHLTGDGESRLAEALADDPDLAVIIRPSVDMHLADVWQCDPHDRRSFAGLVARLVDDGHALAGIAAARVAVLGTREATDLRWVGSAPAETAATILGWLAGAMEAIDTEHRPDIVAAMPAWTTMTTDIVERLAAENLPVLTDQVRRVLWQLKNTVGLTPAAAESWADCAQKLMRHVLDEPDSRGWLAAAAAHFLVAAVEIDPTHVETIRETLTPQVMAAWDSRYLTIYTENIETIAQASPILARDVFTAILDFTETSNAPTSLGGPVLTMISTRSQDFNTVQYGVGRRMRLFTRSVGPVLAAAVLAKALHRRENDVPDVSGYPISVGQSHGEVSLWDWSLKHGPGFGMAEQALTGYVAALGDCDPETVDQDALIGELVTHVRHPIAWKHLLDAASRHLDNWGQAFLEPLLAGGLLVHHRTRAAAGRFIAAISPSLDQTERATLTQAIHSAPRLFPTPDDDRAARLRSELIPCVRTALPDEQPALRPQIAEPDDDIEAFWVGSTLEDLVGADTLSELTDQQRAAVETLRQAVDATSNSPDHDQVDALRGAVEAVLRSVPRGNPADSLTELTFRGIDNLARRTAIDPASELGNMIMAAVLDAVEGPAGD